MDKEKYSFLSQPDPYYAVVTDRKSIAKFQAKHGALGVLSDTKKNLIIRELVKDKSDGKCYSVERCISHVENEAVFIPVFNGRVVVYSLYRYPQHQYCYEFLRSCQNIKENTPKELFSSFSMCSGIEINLIDRKSVV